MKARCGKGDGQRLETLKKRLFIIACNVVVAALLLIYVTYSQYRIQLTATVQMPQAGQIYAALTLTPDQSVAAGGEITWDNFLSKLAPGDDPLEFAGNAQDKNHHFTVTVTNTQSTHNEDGSETAYTAEVDMEYQLRIYTTGRLPLRFVLVPEAEDGQERVYYISQVLHRETGDTTTDTLTNTMNETSSSTSEHEVYEYYFVPYTPTSGKATARIDATEAAEKTFSFRAGVAETHTYAIYCGWDTGDESGDYRKEVEHLEVRAQLTSKAGTVDSGQEPDQVIIYQTVGNTQ